MDVDYQQAEGRNGADVEQTLTPCVHTLAASFLALTGGKLMFSDFGQGEGVQTAVGGSQIGPEGLLGGGGEPVLGQLVLVAGLVTAV